MIVIINRRIVTFLAACCYCQLQQRTWVRAQQNSMTANPTECLTSVDPSVDYFPIKVSPTVSAWWNITYHNTYKILTNYEADTSIALYQCGSAAPTANTTGNNVTHVIQIPIDQVGVMATPTLTFLEQINQLGSIQYFMTDLSYISSPCFLDMIDRGDVIVPAPGVDIVDNATGQIVSQAPPDTPLNGTIAFGSSFDAPSFFQTIVPVSEFMELTNAAIFEWVKYYAALYNAEEAALAVFQAAEAQWECVSTAASSVASDKAPAQVLWAMYSAFCGGGWMIGTCPNYYCEFATGCGAALVDVSSVNGTIASDECTGAILYSTEQLVELGKDAEYFFYMATDWNDTYTLLSDDLLQLTSVQLQQVYDYQGSGENAWFEERYAQYYDVLQDFCRVVGTYTGTLNSPHGWFRNVFTEDIGDQGTCDPTATPTLPFVFEGCDNGVDIGNGNGNGNDTTTSDDFEPPSASSATSIFKTNTSSFSSLSSSSSMIVTMIGLVMASIWL